MHLSRYVYRSVSPHGHVYWEIDPNYVLLNQQQQQHAQQQQPLLLEEHLLQQQQHHQQQQQLLLQQQHGSAESSGDTNSSRESSARFNSCSSSNEQRPLISSPVRAPEAPFVRTGASRFGSRFRPQAAAGATSEAADVPDSGKPPEQLQTQVQIKDCKALKVQVKSSEYIEAKIRTLRRNNNVALNN